ncbi:hybrid sensor histidine kinase/response regulator transcription factor [Flavivirga sp. 57AJ16]|uniref:hybrid sensor histidine kinase/response regulator transcription factor n=1 Tax=Flavivirga sp. 57AJ16 TaxID=3025307 RepID=UPI0023663B4F|nr:hybrid sensor histidine kinase/response regulator transcription factor [Flavivirga sp. 57AJ16]MDD7887556.1 response regulator [Flavivirga sp. 57AJ16]
MKGLSLIIVFIIFISQLYGNDVRNINSRHGLSNSAVTCLFQDSERYLWMGTYDGLNKYNGIDIKVYKPSINNTHSLSGNVVKSIIESEHGYLWILTKSGLDQYSKKSDRVEAHFSNFGVNSLMAIDSNGTFYVMNQEGKLYWFDFKEQVFNEIRLPDTKQYKNCENFIIDSHDTIWISNNGIIKRFDISYSPNSEPLLSPMDNFKHTQAISDTFYDNDEKSVIFIDEKRDLYVVRQDTVEYIKNISSLITQYGGISSILYDDKDILIAFRVSGLIKLTNKNDYQVEKMFMNCGVFSLLKDKTQDIIWVGTDGQGVQAYINEEFVFNGIDFNELPINIQRPVRAIYTDNNHDLWLGTKGDGIVRVKDYQKGIEKGNRTNIQHITSSEGLSGNAIYAFEESKKNKLLWIGSNGPQLDYYSYKDQKIHRLINKTPTRFVDVHSILETSDSTLWVASYFDLLKVKIQKHGDELEVREVKKYDFDRAKGHHYNQVFSIKQENDSILWLGMRGSGALRLNHFTGNYHLVNFEKNGIAPMNDILSVCIGRDGSKWFGSSYGLAKIGRNRDSIFQYENYNESDGLQNNTVHGILENKEGKLWLSTNSGIVLFDPQEHIFKNFDQRTGLKVIEFSDNAYYEDKTTSTYFFGGIDGVVWVKQGQKTANDYVPPVYFTNLRFFNEDHNINDFMVNKDNQEQLRLNYSQNFFTVSFVVNDFINGRNGKYSYKLENFSETWMDANNREAQFTNIPPGDYILKVKYQGGVTGQIQTASLNISILPPWYLSVYAKIVYGIVVVSLLFLFNYYKRRKYEEKQKKVAQRLDQKYKEKAYESKLRFFTNITHEFCTPLTLINTPSERILNYEGSDSFIKKHALTIKSNATRLNNLVQEIIDFRRIETGHKNYVIKSCNINTICDEIVKSFADLAEENNVTLSLNLKSEIIWNLDPNSFSKTLTNLISNAFKYTPKNGLIRVAGYTEKNELILKVYNTGKGIDPKYIPFIFNRYSVLDNVDSNSIKGLSSRNGLGLAICKSLVTKHGGTIDVTSQVDQYAEFIVKLPAAKPSIVLKYDSISQECKGAKVKDIKQRFTESFEQLDDSTQFQKASKHTRNCSSILIVDDNQEIGEILNEILKEEYNIVITKSGNEAFEKLINTTPDLVITDVMMPDMDGISFTKKIKGDPHINHIPVIILSAKTTLNDKIVGIESGADAYISKPFDTHYLKTVVQQLLDKNLNLKKYYNSAVSGYDYLNGQLLAKEDKDFINLAVEIIEDNISNDNFNHEDLAANLKVSLRSLYRKFKDLELPSPKDFIKEQRITYAAKLILKTNLTIQEVMYNTGFTTRSHFYNEFKKRYKQSPTKYRQSGGVDTSVNSK